MRVLLVCGGTGGHIFPAVGLAQELKKRGHSDMVFITSDNTAAKAMIEAAGFDSVETLKAPKMPYGFSVGWPLFFMRLIASYSKAKRIIAAVNPDIAIGFGAYVSGPAIFAAKAKGIKTLIHEQNVFLGRANRLLLGKADRVCLSFTHKLLAQGGKYALTGNPIRQGLIEDLKKVTKNEALLHFGFSSRKKTLLVLGGSSGASAINNLLIELSEKISRAEADLIQIIHIAGRSDYESVSKGYRAGKVNHWVKVFYERMGLAYKAADLILCRGGAATIAEASLFSVPAVFIPYPWAASHQRDNSAAAVNIGGAVALEEASLTVDGLKRVVFGLLNDSEALKRMGSAMRSLAKSDAATKLADVVEELANAE